VVKPGILKESATPAKMRISLSSLGRQAWVDETSR